MSRQTRAATAKETLEILKKGYYFNLSQQKVQFDSLILKAQKNSILYTPQDFQELFLQRDKVLTEYPTILQTQFIVKNATTLQAVRDALAQGATKIVCLNFASAKNPGGGFLGGSQAQEESLARASALYPCIVQMKEMYQTNKQFGSCLYTDHMIYSPDVPVFRDDTDQLLDSPYLTSIITAPAVNAGCIRSNEPEKIGLISEVMRRRIEQVLSIALKHQYHTFVLGAWGCGVFQNDPKDIANYFKEYLLNHHSFKNHFREIIFAILDNSKEETFIKPFDQIFKNTN